jgi:hypothetical protein
MVRNRPLTNKCDEKKTAKGRNRNRKGSRKEWEKNGNRKNENGIK